MYLGDWTEIAEHDCGKAMSEIDGRCNIVFRHPCPKCGESMTFDNTKFKIARWVSHPVWWNPTTWLAREVEYKP